VTATGSTAGMPAVHGDEGILHEFFRDVDILHEQRGEPDQGSVVHVIESGYCAVRVLVHQDSSGPGPKTPRSRRLSV
jgi:hypothetical protein